MSANQSHDCHLVYPELVPIGHQFFPNSISPQKYIGWVLWRKGIREDEMEQESSTKTQTMEAMAQDAVLKSFYFRTPHTTTKTFFDWLNFHSSTA